MRRPNTLRHMDKASFTLHREWCLCCKSKITLLAIQIRQIRRLDMVVSLLGNRHSAGSVFLPCSPALKHSLIFLCSNQFRVRGGLFIFVLFCFVLFCFVLFLKCFSDEHLFRSLEWMVEPSRRVTKIQYLMYGLQDLVVMAMKREVWSCRYKHFANRRNDAVMSQVLEMHHYMCPSQAEDLSLTRYLHRSR